MPKRCICERPQLAEKTPTTHRGVKHLSTCEHSTLAADTKRWTGKKLKAKAVPGTRRIIVVREDAA